MIKYPIEIMEQRGEAVLAQYRDAAGELHRVYVPRSSVSDSEVEELVLQQGIPYGVYWELLPVGQVGSKRIAERLRENNIWTKEDAQKHVPRVRMALQQAYAEDLKILLEAVR